MSQGEVTVQVSTISRMAVMAGLTAFAILGVAAPNASAAELASTAAIGTNRCIMMDQTP